MHKLVKENKEKERFEFVGVSSSKYMNGQTVVNITVHRRYSVVHIVKSFYMNIYTTSVHCHNYFMIMFTGNYLISFGIYSLCLSCFSWHVKFYSLLRKKRERLEVWLLYASIACLQ